MSHSGRLFHADFWGSSQTFTDLESFQTEHKNLHFRKPPHPQPRLPQTENTVETGVQGLQFYNRVTLEKPSNLNHDFLICKWELIAPVS